MCLRKKKNSKYLKDKKIKLGKKQMQIIGKLLSKIQKEVSLENNFPKGDCLVGKLKGEPIHA